MVTKTSSRWRLLFLWWMVPERESGKSKACKWKPAEGLIVNNKIEQENRSNKKANFSIWTGSDVSRILELRFWWEEAQYDDQNRRKSWFMHFYLSFLRIDLFCFLLQTDLFEEKWSVDAVQSKGKCEIKEAKHFPLTISSYSPAIIPGIPHGLGGDGPFKFLAHVSRIMELRFWWEEAQYNDQNRRKSWFMHFYLSFLRVDLFAFFPSFLIILSFGAFSGFDVIVK